MLLPVRRGAPRPLPPPAPLTPGCPTRRACGKPSQLESSWCWPLLRPALQTVQMSPLNRNESSHCSYNPVICGSVFSGRASSPTPWHSHHPGPPPSVPASDAQRAGGLGGPGHMPASRKESPSRGAGEGGRTGGSDSCGWPGREAPWLRAHTLSPFSQRKASPVVFFLLLEVVARCEEKTAFGA